MTLENTCPLGVRVLLNPQPGNRHDVQMGAQPPSLHGHKPAEQLAAGTGNSFKASVGKFGEGKCFETGYVSTNTIPPSGPELQVFRSNLGGSTGCQCSPCIPSLAPSLLPPSSWAAEGCLVPPTDSCWPSLYPAHVQRQLENSVSPLKPP